MTETLRALIVMSLATMGAGVCAYAGAHPAAVFATFLAFAAGIVAAA
jgi:hypothetical protein